MAQTVENSNAPESETSLIAVTTVQTLFWLAVLSALFFTLFTLLFPVSAYKLYDGINNLPRAYDCARRAADNEKGEAAVSARLYCVNTSITLCYENRDYAVAVEESTRLFLTDTACAARIPAIDAHNLASSNRSIHPNLYSYADYLRSQNAHARFLLGNDNAVYNGRYLTLSAALETDTESLAAEATLLGQISAVLDAARESGGAMPDFTAESLENRAREFLAAALTLDPQNLETLYYVKTYQKLAVRYALAFPTRQDLTEVLINGTTQPINTLYSTMLETYVNNL